MTSLSGVTRNRGHPPAKIVDIRVPWDYGVIIIIIIIIFFTLGSKDPEG